MKELDKEIKGHDYDGITEYDNPLPNWWLMSFFATIIFAFIYWLHYEIAGGPNLSQELAAAMKRIEAGHAQAPAAKFTDDELAQAAKDPGEVAAGLAVFTTRCASCHGEKLQGMIGPNLTDAYWLHGKGTGSDIAATILAGVPDKGMPPWQGLLKNEEVKQVVALILSRVGSSPPGAKAPQGEKHESARP